MERPDLHSLQSKKKPARPAPLSIRLEPHLVKALRDVCAKEERSISFVIRRAVKDHLGISKPKGI